MMTPAQLIIMALITQGPDFARKVIAIFQKDNPTTEDWDVVFAAYKKPYDAYIAEAQKQLPM